MSYANWNPTEYYVSNDIVFYDGKYYQALVSSINVVPDANPATWSLNAVFGINGVVEGTNITVNNANPLIPIIGLDTPLTSALGMGANPIIDSTVNPGAFGDVLTSTGVATVWQAPSSFAVTDVNGLTGSITLGNGTGLSQTTVGNTITFDNIGCLNPMGSDLDGNNLKIQNVSTLTASKVETEQITLPAGSLNTAIAVDNNLQLAAGQQIGFATDIKLKNTGAGDVIIDSVPAGSQTNILGYDTATKKVSYQAVPSAGVTSIAAGTGIAVNNLNPAIPVVSNTGVTSAVAGTGIGVSAGTGSVTFSNTGVLSVANGGAGSGITIGGTAQNPTVSNAGVLTVAAGTGIASSGGQNPSISNTGLLSATAGTGISVSAGQNPTISNTGVTSIIAGTGISVSAGTGAVTITNTSGGGSFTDPIAIGTGAGVTAQSLGGIAIGVNAGNNTQGVDAVAIGKDAAPTSQPTRTVAVGSTAGTQIRAESIAIGYQSESAVNASSTQNTVVGTYTAALPQTFTNAIGQHTAIGYSALQRDNGGPQSTAVGANALQNGTSAVGRSVAVGYNTLTNAANYSAVAVGWGAGRNSTGNGIVAIGDNAGANMGSLSVAVGNGAGAANMTTNSVAIGFSAGNTNMATQSVAIGSGAGQTSQPTQSVAVGADAGAALLAGAGGQVVVGYRAGRQSGANAVALGIRAGEGTQGSNTVAIGNTAAQNGQGTGAIAIGNQAANGSSGANSVAIGTRAGFGNFGTRSIAIGNLAAEAGGTFADTITLNASSIALNPAQASSLFINPIRVPASTSAFTSSLLYNPTTSEVAQMPTAYISAFGNATQNLAVPATETVLAHGAVAVAGTGGLSLNTGTGVFTIGNAGVYRILTSVQITTAAGNSSVVIYPSIGGTAIPNSASKCALGNSDAVVFTCEYIYTAAANDQLTIRAYLDSGACDIEYTGASAPKPAIPSVITNIQRIA